ncbi:glycosyltransferase family 4 protein [Frigoribacterium sp. CFBP 8751]|uniref:glycosyltransferase family 4 protein n=1 Tax=Frigoribacterium sp. CFBP 8751 TaxID=2775277 RepID=UPI001785F163|nr:glycosyltransferase family 1 protein [Frigoribacterium sp. CFBP 8751]MBD8538711.1 glycosyltransferase family 1 protein [Frigoribacterium sp. CFBP 8751]
MRVVIVTESFLPTVNGVTTSVLRVLDHLARRGHEALVIAPAGRGTTSYAGFPVHRVPSVAYRQFPVGLPNPQVAAGIAGFRPDVVHVASPFLLGAQAIAAAARLGVPSVAVFQTDVARYAGTNGLGLGSAVAWRLVRRIHDQATTTLVPSRASLRDLETAGVGRLATWGRGVDSALFHPNRKSGDAVRALRESWGAPDRVLVGYVGRLAPEKQVERLAALRPLREARLVVVGGGPSLPALRRRLRNLDPVFTGPLHGEQLADAYAALDVFVHTGSTETFGQTVQEAHASGLPVVAPAAGGPLDLVRHGVDGFLFDPRHDHSLRRSVRTLVSSDELRARFGEAGRRVVVGRTWETLGDELVEHYRRAMASVRDGAERASVR